MIAYLDGLISLGRAATLLGLALYELDGRFGKLDAPDWASDVRGSAGCVHRSLRQDVGAGADGRSSA